MDKDKVIVYIPRKLYNLIKRRVEESSGEFKSVEDYIEFVLKEIVTDEEEKQTYTKEEEEEIKKRLRALGYID